MSEQLLKMALLAESSYIHHQHIPQHYKGYNKVYPVFAQTFHAHKNMFHSVAYKDDLYLTFKGTDNKIDMAKNVLWYPKSFVEDEPFPKWVKERYGDASVHMGLYLRYRHVLASCEKIILQNRFKNIYFASHSAGSLSAFVEASLILRYPHLRLHHYSFGSPKLGNETFKDLFGTLPIIHSCRVTYKNDPVPHIPFFKSEWCHPERYAVHLGSDYEKPDLNDHSMSAYISTLAEIHEIYPDD